MTDAPADFEIFLATVPGLEPVLHDEVRNKGFKRPRPVPGGVVLRGGWPEVWRANLWVRGAGRVLARVAAFRAVHLAQLDDLARRVPWNTVLRPDVPFRVEASCARSRLYHSGAVAQRIETAIRESTGAPHDPDAGITVMARLENDLCTLSVDTSGEPLHKRGHKEAVNAAPMRETMAALMLHQCGFRGTEPLVDPMCGSGTFVIEAAAIAARLNPGRDRHFAFERLRSFDPAEWARMRAAIRGHSSDRNCVRSWARSCARAPSLTNMPSPRRFSTTPTSTRASKARVTVRGLTESSALICRTDGRASPSPTAPLRIISMSRWRIWTKMGWLV